MRQSNTIFQKNLIYSIVLFSLGAVFGGVVTLLGFIAITGGTSEPSVPIAAPTLAVPAAVPSEALAEILEPITAIEEPPATAVHAASEEVLAIAEPTDLPTLEPSPTVMPTATPRLYRIDISQSEARFSVYETFPEGTAVGRTNQLAGDILVDFESPNNSQLGVIRINLRSLVTDDARRDSSIRCCVLLTAQDAYEFGEFVPITLSGLPDAIELGQPYNISVTGNLTIRGVTQQTTFDVMLMLDSVESLSGRASTTVNRTDFNILNDADNGFDYHGVEEAIELEFDFVAIEVVQN